MPFAETFHPSLDRRRRGSVPAPAPSSITALLNPAPVLQPGALSSAALATQGTGQSGVATSPLRPDRPDPRTSSRTTRQRILQRVLRGVADVAESEIGGSGMEARDIARDAINASEQTGVPASLLIGLTGQESAYGTNVGPSSAGARGRAQFIPSTREAFLDQFHIDPWSQRKGQDILGAALHLEEYGATPYSQDPIAALNSYSGGYGDSAYNNPILARAKQFHQTGIDKLAAGGKVPSTGPQAPPRARLEKWLPGGENNDYRKTDPELLRQSMRVARASDDPININSGFRTRAEQEAAYADYLAGGTLAAKPGTSNHEFGNALDLDLTDDQRALFPKYGLGLPVAGEDWHTELVEDSGYSAGSGGSGLPSLGYGSPVPSGGPGLSAGNGEPIDTLLSQYSAGRNRGGGSSGVVRNSLSARAATPLEMDEEESLMADLEAAYRPQRRRR